MLSDDAAAITLYAVSIRLYHCYDVTRLGLWAIQQGGYMWLLVFFYFS